MIADPFDRFEQLWERAQQLDIKFPDAMVVSSVGADGRPSSRYVLLKSFDRAGFVFYTNLESRKGRELLANPDACLNFYWRELGEQVIIEGPAAAVDDAEADAYFATRPRGSQLGAWASHQSREISSRAALLAEVARVEARYLGRPVPRPPHWSGLRVAPTRFEFWVEGKFRLHQRTEYRWVEGRWEHRLLSP